MSLFPEPMPEPTPEVFARAEARWTHEVPLLSALRGLASPALMEEARRLMEDA